MFNKYVFLFFELLILRNDEGHISLFVAAEIKRNMDPA